MKISCFPNFVHIVFNIFSKTVSTSLKIYLEKEKKKLPQNMNSSYWFIILRKKKQSRKRNKRDYDFWLVSALNSTHINFWFLRFLPIPFITRNVTVVSLRSSSWEEGNIKHAKEKYIMRNTNKMFSLFLSL